MIFLNKLSFTSDPIFLPNRFSTEAYITVTGNGPVYIELLEEDNTYRRFPELTFTSTTAQRIDIPRGKFRVVIEAAVATTVGLRL